MAARWGGQTSGLGPGGRPPPPANLLVSGDRGTGLAQKVCTSFPPRVYQFIWVHLINSG